MRTRFDQLAKELSLATLGAGARAGVPVAVAPQEVDVWFEPDPAHGDDLAGRGLLGRMGRRALGLEAFHNTPGVQDVRDCVRKHLNLHHHRVGVARPGVEVPLARLWVVSAGRPAGVLPAFGLRRAAAWPPGVYRSLAGLALWLVVVPELPPTRETLALRLMGRDDVLRAAVAELTALPGDAWEREHLLPVLVRWRFEIPADPAARDPEEEAFMATAQQLFEDFKRQAIEQGREQGREESHRMVEDFKRQAIEQGRVEGLRSFVHLFARRLRRDLTDGEQATLTARLATLGPERLGDVVLDVASADALAAWLADADAR